MGRPTLNADIANRNARNARNAPAKMVLPGRWENQRKGLWLAFRRKWMLHRLKVCRRTGRQGVASSLRAARVGDIGEERRSGTHVLGTRHQLRGSVVVGEIEDGLG